MSYQTLKWRRDHVELIDQRLLPGSLKYIKCRTAREIWSAIRYMKVRGAPAIGIAGAFGVYLGVRNARARTPERLVRETEKVTTYLASSRPTARNLFWALEKMNTAALLARGEGVEAMKKAMLREALCMLEEDIRINRAIGRNGARLIGKGSSVLTHCNAGALATVDYGTALGVIIAARNKIRMVYADETRPVLQGARLTVWELVTEKVPATLICDNMAASLMAGGAVDAVVTGADRIAANGDTANKIGTYGLAVLSRYHKVPFYVAAPLSTFDASIRTGRDIVIEERPGDEVRKIGGKYITVRDVDVWNPSFDVTPAGLITGIITEKGVIERPCRGKVRRLLSRGVKEQRGRGKDR